MDRQSALDAVRARLARTLTEPDALLDPEALAEVELLEDAIDLEPDLAEAQVLGGFYWWRAVTQAQRGVVGDYGSVLRYFLPILWQDPGSVPREFRNLIENSPELAPFARAGARELGQIAYRWVDAFEASRDPSKLDTASMYFRAAFARTPVGDQLRLLRLSDLGVCLRDRYSATHERAVARELVKVERAAVELARGGDHFAERVRTLVHVLSLQAAQAPHAEMYDVPIGVAREALADPTAPASQRPALLGTLSRTLRDKHEAVGDGEAMRECVALMREAAALSRHDAGEHFESLYNLAVALTTEYDRTGDNAVLDEKLRIVRELAYTTPARHPRHAEVLASFSDLLVQICMTRRPAPPSLVDECVQAARRALGVLPADAPNRYGRLSILGLVLGLSYTVHGRIGEFRESVTVYAEAARAIPLTHPGRDASYDVLCSTARFVFESTDSTEDLRQLIAALQESLPVITLTDTSKAAELSDVLCASLCMLYTREGDVDRLRHAVEAGSRSVAATSVEHPGRAARLTNLSHALGELSAQTGDDDLRRRALACEREVVALTPVDDSRRAMYFNNLSTTLQRLYRSTHDVELLHEAVQASQEAIASAGRDDPRRAGYYTGMGGALREVYLHDEQNGPLEQLVRAERDAVEALAPDDPDRAMILNNLASALQLQWFRTHEREALREMIEVSRAALVATPDTAPARIGREINLVTGLEQQFDETGDFSDLREAAVLARSVVERTPQTHPERAYRLGTLTTVLLKMFEESGTVAADGTISISIDQAARFEDPIAGAVERLLSGIALRTPEMLDEALVAAREAERLTRGRPEHAEHLLKLGQVLAAWADHAQRPEALEEARDAYREAGSEASGSLFVRIRALRDYARLSKTPKSAEAGLSAIEEAVDLLGALAPHSLVRSDREYQLSRLGQLPAEAAGAALDAGYPARAVELLERTRGILAADVLSQREHDSTMLRERAPELADRLEQLRGTTDTDADTGEDAAALVRNRRAAAEMWQPLIREIRRVPGFERYMRSASLDELLPHLDGGPVVYVVAGASRSDALVLDATAGKSAHPVQVIPLGGLTQSAVYQHADRIHAATRLVGDATADPDLRIQAQGRILETLAWLWDQLAEPVLDQLGYSAAPGDAESWPRLRWCPVGPLAALPLHAAGHYAAGGPSALDRVVSSYTTTVAAMARRRSGARGPARNALIVTAAGAGRSLLRAVAAEAEEIRLLVPEARRLDDPSPGEVLGMLHEYDIAHFACHALSDPDDPSRSRLLLGGLGSAPLSIADIGGLKLDSPLAYLSACATTLPARRLTDEALHLTGAFHLAGYRHVVGSLWPIDDKTAAEIAKGFYSGLIDPDTSALDTDRAAWSLNAACRRQRDRFPKTPAAWAAHIHLGS